MRTRCSAFVFMSLDGFVAPADGDEDRFHSIIERPPEDYGFGRFWESIDTLVLGRRTYDAESHTTPWPLGGMHIVVLTRTALWRPLPGALAGGKVEAHAGDPGPLVARLSAEGARRIYVAGASAVRQFLAADLLTDLTTCILPVLLGGGVALFPSPGRELRLELTACTPYPSGAVQIEYRLGVA
jgi:dihydrofolate reductase